MKKVKWLLAGLILAGSLGMTNAVQAQDDLQYWSRYLLKGEISEKLSWKFYSEARFYEEVERLNLYLFSPQLVYKVNDNLDLGLNYTHLRVWKAAKDSFDYQHRIEPEINPHFKPFDWLTVQTRNRVEFRWIEDNGSYNTRTRNRLRLVFPVKNFGPLTSVFVDSEFFYNFAEHAHDEQRTIPVGLNFKVNPEFSFQTFWMIQNKKTDTWKSNQVLGTMLTYKF